MKQLLIAAGLGLIIIVSSCTVAPGSSERAERRANIERHNATALAYSEFLRGRYASLTNDPHQAAIFYRNAAQSNPQDVDLLERAVFTSLISGDVASAQQVALAADMETVSETSLPRLVLGASALKAGRTKRAEQLLLPETSSLFNDTISLGLIAWARQDREGADAAVALLEASKPKDDLLAGVVQSAQGFILLHDGQADAAQATFQDMWDNGLRLAVSTEYLARLLDQAGERDKAISILTNFSNRVGQNAAIEHLKDELKQGAKLAPPKLSRDLGAALAVYIPAAALATQTNTDLAGVYFALALDLDPDLHVARTLWGDALDNADRREDAITVLRDVPESSPFYATSRGQMAWALRREDRNDEALQTASMALAAAPDRNLKIQLGDLFRSLGQLDEADRIFSEIIAFDEARGVKDWRLFYARGAAREQLDRWPEAEADLLIAHDLAPDRPALLNYLGYSWIDRGENLDEGFEMIKRAVELRPNAGFIVDSLGWAHYKLGNYEEAVRQLERAVELSPGEPVLNEHLGDAYWRVGRKLEAGFQWNRAIRLAPESDNVILLEAKLETGLVEAAPLVASREMTQAQ